MAPAPGLEDPPATRTSIDGASPQTTSPTENSTNDARSGPTDRGGRSVRLPRPCRPRRWRAERRTTARSAGAVSCLATVGITVVTAVASNAVKATSANMPMVVAACAGARSAARLGDTMG